MTPNIIHIFHENGSTLTAALIFLELEDDADAVHVDTHLLGQRPNSNEDRKIRIRVKTSGILRRSLRRPLLKKFDLCRPRFYPSAGHPKFRDKTQYLSAAWPLLFCANSSHGQSNKYGTISGECSSYR